MEEEKYTTRRNVNIVISIITSVLSAVQIIPLFLMFAGIDWFNSNCAGGSCDGCTTQSCDSSSSPGLFLLLTLWRIETIAMTCVSFWCWARAIYLSKKISDNNSTNETYNNKY